MFGGYASVARQFIYLTNNYMPKETTSTCCEASATMRGGCDDREHQPNDEHRHTLYYECDECGKACRVKYKS